MPLHEVPRIGRASEARMRFDYESAFDRNIGWVTELEQKRLRGRRVAIAGMGGVGGAHLLTLCRLGIGDFHIADMDCFEVSNFNRQVGANMGTVGEPKVLTMADMAQRIRPDASIRPFADGIHSDNIDEFLEGVDLFVDGLDFFATDARRLAFRRCAELGIPAITAAPIGMGTTCLLFMPGSMTFEEYFGLDSLDSVAQIAGFYAGLTPHDLHSSYLVDPSRLDLSGKKGPSTPMAVQLCASVVGSEAVRVLLGRQHVRPAPWCLQLDLYKGVLVHRRMWGGSRHPRIALKRWLATRAMRKQVKETRIERTEIVEARPKDAVEAIIDLARWTPSGDNSQPWRFERVSDDTIDIRLTDQGDEDVYDCDGQATLLSGGMLLENMRIAATRHGRAFDWLYAEKQGHTHLLRVNLPRAPEVRPDLLGDFIRARSVDRRPYRLTPLTEVQRKALEGALGSDLQLRWHERLVERLRLSKLNRDATDVRLRIPEAQSVHRRIVDFEREFSPTGVPASSIGLNPLVLRMMRWSMQSPRREQWLTRLTGTLGASLEMDILPGIFCAGHFMVALPHESLPSDRTTALLKAGQGLMRTWLECSRQGLALQPSFAPLSFAYYAEKGQEFTADPWARAKAARIARRLRGLWPGHDAGTIVFMARVGIPQTQAPGGRSIRRPTSELLVDRRQAMTGVPKGGAWIG